MSNQNLTSNENLRPRSWRTQATHDRYLSERVDELKTVTSCPLCDAKTIQAFKYWRIIDNKYPYDAVAQVHHQLIPLRHTAGADLTPEEMAEFLELKKTTLNDNYALLMEALPKNKSIPGHFHYHLIAPKQIN